MDLDRSADEADPESGERRTTCAVTTCCTWPWPRCPGPSSADAWATRWSTSTTTARTPSALLDITQGSLSLSLAVVGGLLTASIVAGAPRGADRPLDARPRAAAAAGARGREAGDGARRERAGRPVGRGLGDRLPGPGAVGLAGPGAPVAPLAGVRGPRHGGRAPRHGRACWPSACSSGARVPRSCWGSRCGREHARRWPPPGAIRRSSARCGWCRVAACDAGVAASSRCAAVLSSDPVAGPGWSPREPGGAGQTARRSGASARGGEVVRVARCRGAASRPGLERRGCRRRRARTLGPTIPRAIAPFHR